MIHLKLYGLPRTGTNVTAYNIQKTWPGLVRVWHNNGPEDEEPYQDKYWKHGVPKIVPGMDGYILLYREYEDWQESFMRYRKGSGKQSIQIMEDWVELLYVGWNKKAFIFRDNFLAMSLEATHIGEALPLMVMRFDLPEPDHYHLETRRLKQCGDATPLDEYCSNEIWKAK